MTTLVRVGDNVELPKHLRVRGKVVAVGEHKVAILTTSLHLVEIDNVDIADSIRVLAENES